MILTDCCCKTCVCVTGHFCAQGPIGSAGFWVIEEGAYSPLCELTFSGGGYGGSDALQTLCCDILTIGKTYHLIPFYSIGTVVPVADYVQSVTWTCDGTCPTFDFYYQSVTIQGCGLTFFGIAEDTATVTINAFHSFTKTIVGAGVEATDFLFVTTSPADFTIALSDSDALAHYLGGGLINGPSGGTFGATGFPLCLYIYQIVLERSCEWESPQAAVAITVTVGNIIGGGTSSPSVDTSGGTYDDVIGYAYGGTLGGTDGPYLTIAVVPDGPAWTGVSYEGPSTLNGAICSPLAWARAAAYCCCAPGPEIAPPNLTLVSAALGTTFALALDGCFTGSEDGVACRWTAAKAINYDGCSTGSGFGGESCPAVEDVIVQFTLECGGGIGWITAWRLTCTATRGGAFNCPTAGPTTGQIFGPVAAVGPVWLSGAAQPIDLTGTFTSFDFLFCGGDSYTVTE